MLTASDYARERAIVDTADAYRSRVAPSRTYLTAEEAAHPDYASCDNAMRGRVEQYEILADPPERFTAYVSSDEKRITTWTGGELGSLTLGLGWVVRSCFGSRMYQGEARIRASDGTTYVYTGRTFGGGMCISLRETAASRRRTRAVKGS